ncbi:hypothetical protein Tco_1411777 [Tanacetum coccineum]
MLCLTAPASSFVVGESSIAASARQTRPTLARRVDYGFIDTMDASIQASGSRVMTVVEEISLLTRERRYFHSMASSYEREAVYSRQTWSRLKDRSMDLEALIKAQEARTIALEAQTREL